MVSSCRDLARLVPEISLPDYRIHIIQVRPYLMPRGWHVRPHEHSFFEVNAILRGTARDDASPKQLLGPGDLFVHGPQTPHSWGAPEQNCIRLVLWFTVDPPVRMSIPKHWPSWPWLLHDIAHLMNHATQRRPGWINQVAARLAVVISQMLTMAELPAMQRPLVARPDPLVTAVNSYLEDNFARPISLSDVASCAGVSLSGMVHRYRDATGVTVLQRLLAIRMEQAAYLLNETELPLKTICGQVGVQQAAYLCRLFRRYFHTSPGEFRRFGTTARPRTDGLSRQSQSGSGS